MTRSDIERVRDARHHAQEAISRLRALERATDSNRQLIFQAPLFNLVVISTTFGKISKPVQALSPDLPWRDVIDTRNRIVHAYWQVEAGLLSSVTVARLKRLARDLDRLPR